MLYLKLFLEFFKIGLFSIGGGLATLPFLQELGEKTGWYTMGDLTRVIAVSESTPGPLGVNMATYTGNVSAGVPGGIIATVGLVTPSVIVIILVAKFLTRFKNNRYVEYVLEGIRPASTALITLALFAVAKNALISVGTGLKPLECALAVGFVIAIKYIKLHPIWFIGISAALGVALGL